MRDVILVGDGAGRASHILALGAAVARGARPRQETAPKEDVVHFDAAATNCDWPVTPARKRRGKHRGSNGGAFGGKKGKR